MTRLLAAVLWLLASTAAAQVTPYPSREPATKDFAQLPMAIKAWFPPPPGWQGHTSFWMTAIWPRNVNGSGAGAWYRSDGDALVLSVYSSGFFPRPYTCKFAGVQWLFQCTDAFGAVKVVDCPEELSGSPEPVEWKSAEVNPSTNDNWFWWSWDNGTDAKWRAWTERLVVPLGGGSVDATGKVVTCFYPMHARVGGPLVTVDVWTMLR